MDTNVLIWLVTDNSRAADLVPEIEDLSNEIYFSSASVWEIAIKNQIGKLNIDPSDAAEEFLKVYIRAATQGRPYTHIFSSLQGPIRKCRPAYALFILDPRMQALK